MHHRRLLLFSIFALTALGAADAHAQYVEDPGPAAAFTFSPVTPTTGETITFTSTSRPSMDEITALEWDLDNDGSFDDAQGAQVSWVFNDPGSHTVRLRVTQTNGKQNVAFSSVEVAERAVPPPGRMRPFPRVRIAGVILPRAAMVHVLSVRGPRSAQVRVRCSGRGCPARAVTRTISRRLVRFGRFERRLRAGIRLELFVSQPGKVGKYTRFRIRAGKAPARVDRCLPPGSERPIRCS
jgi:hypothetical protein